MKKTCFFISILVFSVLVINNGFCEANNTITEIKGDVFIIKKDGFRKNFAEENQGVIPGDLIITGKESTAVIKSGESSFIIIEQNSKFKINEAGVYNQEEGKTFYSIEKKEQKGIQVKTPFAVIGVKGTEFIVNADKDSQSVALDRGLINIKSLKDKFELHRKEDLSAFESFMEKTKSAFTDYKEKNRKEFVEYVDEFDLKPDKMVSFSDSRAKEEDISEEMSKEFDKFRAMLK
ncbi:MAG: FecR domain-containing protein [Thermodesulfobacteriota bacterium]